MDKKTVLAILLSILVWFGWDLVLEKRYPGYKERVRAQQTQEMEKTKSSSEEIVSNNQSKSNTTGFNLSQNSNNKTEQFETISKAKVPVASEEQLTISNEEISILFSQEEASIKRVWLKKYKEKQNDNEEISISKGVELERLKSRNSFFTQIYESQQYGSQYRLESKEEKTIIFSSVIGAVRIRKTYTLLNPYYLLLSVNIVNQSSVPFSTKLKTVLYDVYKEPERSGGFLAGGGAFNTSGAVVKASEGMERIAYTDISADTKNDGLWGVKGLHVNWLGMDTLYFLKALLPSSDKQNLELYNLGNNLYGLALVESITELQSRQSIDLKYNLYLGPKDIDLLEQYGSGLDEAIDFSMLSIIAVPILKSLKSIYSAIGNYGISIILLTAIIKLILLPLTWKASISMKRMQKLQPQLKKIQEKYKEDRQRQSQETMAFMKSHNMNPLGGCLPILLQMPIFLALYRVLYNSIELRNAYFVGWVVDLSEKDPFFILPVLTGILMFVQQKIMPTTVSDPNQKKMFLIINVLFTALMLFLPSGAVLYILTNMTLSIFQQFLINKYAKVE